MQSKSGLMLLLWWTVVLGSESMANPEAGHNYDHTVGWSVTELRNQYPNVADISNSFRLLISKNLAPRAIPEDHSFLRLGKTYWVFEIKAGQVLAVHRVHG